jgi:hypothetical protein
MKMLSDDPQDLISAFTDLGFRFRMIDDGLARITPFNLLQREYGNVVATRTSS